MQLATEKFTVSTQKIIMKYHTKLNGPLLILESTIHILIIHIILQCPKIYPHYKEYILIRLPHHSHFTQHEKHGASKEVLFALHFLKQNILGSPFLKEPMIFA
jgi:hypothetical protein